MTQRQSLEAKFWKFHEANPMIYRRLLTLAWDWRNTHGDNAKLGVKALWERMRWDLNVYTDTAPKLNNNYTSFYARLLMDQEPELAGMFRLRQQRRQATIGPSNQGLDPGGQIV